MERVKLGLLSRPSDLLLIILQCYFTYSCFFIETYATHPAFSNILFLVLGKPGFSLQEELWELVPCTLWRRSF